MRKLNLVLTCVALLAVGALAQSLPTATLTVSNPFSGTALGASVAISGSTVAASGAVIVNGRAQGVIYVFTKPATAPWTDMTESAQLTIANGSVGAVGISGDGSIIASIGPGEVCVFVKPTSGWQGTITPVTTLLQSLPPKLWSSRAICGQSQLTRRGTPLSLALTTLEPRGISLAASRLQAYVNKARPTCGLSRLADGQRRTEPQKRPS